VDFLLVLIELFSLGVTAEALQTNIGSKSAISLQRGPVNQKFQVKGVAAANRSFSQKKMIFRTVQKIWTDLSSISVTMQCTRLTDRRTDGQTDRQFSPDQTALHSMQRGNDMPILHSTHSVNQRSYKKNIRCRT